MNPPVYHYHDENNKQYGIVSDGSITAEIYYPSNAPIIHGAWKPEKAELYYARVCVKNKNNNLSKFDINTPTLRLNGKEIAPQKLYTTLEVMAHKDYGFKTKEHVYDLSDQRHERNVAAGENGCISSIYHIPEEVVGDINWSLSLNWESLGQRGQINKNYRLHRINIKK